MLLLSIFAGGALGSVVRYRLTFWVRETYGSGFPWGTLCVNLLGTTMLGLLLPILDFDGPPTLMRAFVTVGFIGALTTFSTFAIEAVLLVREGHSGRAAVYVAASLGLGLACLAGGLLLSELLFQCCA
jgi:fluoride exporter